MTQAADSKATDGDVNGGAAEDQNEIDQEGEDHV